MWELNTAALPPYHSCLDVTESVIIKYTFVICSIITLLHKICVNSSNLTCCVICVGAQVSAHS